MFDSVLIPTDGSEGSEIVVEQGIEVARRHDATIHGLFVVDTRAFLTLESDLQSIPLDDDSVDVILAHGLFNVLTNEEAAAIAAEFTRVAAPGAWLLVDDYDPMPEHAPIRRLFGVENAIAELVDGRPAYVFHPEAGLRRLFAGHGWTHERTKSLLEPVPWPEELFEAHLDAARRSAEPLDDALAEPLLAEAESLTEQAPSPTSRMYSLGLRYSTQ